MNMTNMGVELHNLGLDVTVSRRKIPSHVYGLTCTQLGRALLASFRYGCSQEVLDIVSVSSSCERSFVQGGVVLISQLLMCL